MKKIIFLIALLISDLQAATTIFTNECIFTPNRDFVKIHVLNGLKQATFFSGGIAIFHFADGNGDILGTSSSNGQAFISSGFSYTGNIGNTTPLKINDTFFSVLNKPQTQTRNGKIETVFPICRK